MLLILAGIEQNPGPKMSKQTTLETSLDRDKDIKDLINALTKRLDSWGERLESRLSAIDDRVENINQRLQQLEESSAVTKAALSQNSKKIKDLEDQLEHLDAKSRERNLIFYGIEQDNNEDCRERIRKVIEENMQTTEKINITRCHRLSRKPGAPILIEVPEQNDRLTLFKAALNLRGTKISLSKDYSMKMREQRRVLNVKRRELVEKGTLAKLRDDKLLINGIAYKEMLTKDDIIGMVQEAEVEMDEEDDRHEITLSSKSNLRASISTCGNPITHPLPRLPSTFHLGITTEPVKVDRMTEDSSMQRMTEVRYDYVADALTNMKPHCEDLRKPSSPLSTDPTQQAAFFQTTISRDNSSQHQPFQENRTPTTLQNRTTSPALERAMVTIAHQDNVLQPTNKLSFISPLQPHHMVESSVGPAPQAANINIGYGETPCFNPEEEDIEDHVEEFKTWLTASKVPKGDWTKALVRRLPLDGREFIKCRFDPSAALEDVLEALKLCYPRNDGRARSRGNELKKTRRPQSTEDTGRYLMNLITAHATAGEFSPFDSSKEALWALAPKDCLLLAASWSTTRNPEEADFLQAAKFLDKADKWNKERKEAGTTTSWETTTRTAEEWEQKQGRNPRTEAPTEKARRFMLPDGTPRCFTCYQTGHKHWDCPKRRPRGKYNFTSNPVVEVSNSVESVPRVFSEVTGNTNRIIFRVKGQPGVNEKQTLNKVPLEKSTLEIGGTAVEKFRWTGMTNFCLITHINETHVGKLIFDSGANVSCIDERIANALGCTRMLSKLLIRGISGSVVSNTCTYLEVNIDGFDICGRFTIIPGNGEKIIFGVDILTNYHCKIMFRDESVKLYRPKIGTDDHVVELNEERELERLGTITNDRKNPKQKYCILNNLEIAPRCKTRVKLKGPTVMAGILEPHPDCVRRTGLLIPSVHVSETVSEIFIDVINTRNEPVRLVANSCLLRSGGEIANVSFLSEQVGYSTTATCKYEPQKFDINPELSDSEKIDVLDVLYRYRELFSEEWNKAADIEPYHIKLKANTEPIRQKAYRRSPKERDIIEEQVKEMCEKGVIRKSTSPWASPVVLVKKSDGSYRFCVDYRKVNNVTEKFSYPLPDITDCLDRLAGMKYFSHTNFVSGYWQCPLDETSKPITAFTTGNGLYEFQVLPFGLTGAPGHFERIMDTLLAELKWSECMVYLDDVIVYGRDIREHNERLTNVLECFRGAGLSLKPSKCRFAYQKLPILGHVVSENGVEPATDKIEAVKEFPIPKNVKQVRSFLGLCGYYRRFIKNFSKISKPLTCLTEKDKRFVIGPAEIEAFETLKKKLTEEPILAHFNPDARI
ncbi:hypothetical protein LAZ67_1002346 [Cordylochernes scorpioides]|uniref:Reverse transcriptase n=1 Tax=Cordylochernes scorpioides TaxID=51811 RepID=A0ABY6JW02_9ARAC|nr:hypothetical protein LAZ67_1002346 [Cordylochernes scorpioides]